jgi:SNF2 family DNA or RNA helicase
MREIYKPRAFFPLIQEQLNRVPRTGLWVGMGCGKTSNLLFHMLGDELDAGGFLPTLVLGPKRVAQNVWPAEVDKWQGLEGIRVSTITGDAAQRKAALLKDADLYSTNYENIPWLMEQLGTQFPFKRVIADESTRLKSFRGGWMKHPKTGTVYYRKGGSVRASSIGRFAHKAERWVNLTGTPSPNGLKDLWGQTWFLDFGKRLGPSYSAFTDRWFRTRPGSSKEAAIFEPLPGAEEEILARIKDLHLTLDPYDWFDIDRPVFFAVPVHMDTKAKAQYKKLHDEAVLALSQETVITAVNAGAKVSKCLQFASGAILDSNGGWHEVHTAKLDAVESLIEELNGAPLILAYNFRHDLERLKKRFPQGRVLDDKKQTENDWNEGRIPLLFLHPMSASHGLSLQHGGHNLAFFTQTFDAELYDQVIERIGPVRQAQSGYKRSVNIYSLETQGTWDTAISRRVDDKRTVQDRVREGMKQ